MDDMWTFSKWYGNESIWFWNTTFDPKTGLPIRPEMITGASLELQFKRNIGSGDTLHVWDDTALRAVDMIYVTSYTDEYGIEVYRYRTYDGLYAGTDPYYYGNGTVGFLNATTTGLVTKGGFTPIYASRMFQAGVDPQLRNLVNCTNCPEIPAGLSNDDLDYRYGSYVEVNPELGKSLRGQKIVQLSVEVGQPWLFAGTKYGSIPHAFIPLITYNMTERMNQTQADIVNDGLDSLHFGLNARKGILIGSVVLAIVSGLLSVGLFYRWRTVMLDQIETPTDGYERARGPDGDPHYPGVSHSHAGLEGSRNVQGDSYTKLPGS